MPNTVIIDGVRHHWSLIPKSKEIKPVPEKKEDKKPLKIKEIKPETETTE